MPSRSSPIVTATRQRPPAIERLDSAKPEGHRTSDKVGTFALALGARHDRIPFIVGAPESTVDAATPTAAVSRSRTGAASDVVAVVGMATATDGTAAATPVFDVTPAELMTAVVTDRRIVRLDQHQTPT